MMVLLPADFAVSQELSLMLFSVVYMASRKLHARGNEAFEQRVVVLKIPMGVTNQQAAMNVGGIKRSKITRDLLMLSRDTA